MCIRDRLKEVLRRNSDPALQHVPFSSEAIQAELTSVSIIIGAHREEFDASEYARRVTVGDHLHVIAKREELGVHRPVHWHLYSGAGMREVLRRRGFTAHIGVTFTCEEAIPVEDGSLLECRTVEREWLFETCLDARFENDPCWVICDMEGVMHGNMFWLDVHKSFI
eukprot:TRINITY_DN28746_c0_g1_i2.p1 TRINITY_DN28746_c0_g1~~TRINITY_DN28746_c0_g1_i2.p1  ORF type:complete len:167 (+),score=33.11 TRINITY_DN28746_c0_g1_i2:60-560(+)